MILLVKFSSSLTSPGKAELCSVRRIIAFDLKGSYFSREGKPFHISALQGAGVPKTGTAPDRVNRKENRQASENHFQRKILECRPALSLTTFSAHYAKVSGGGFGKE